MLKPFTHSVTYNGHDFMKPVYSDAQNTTEGLALISVGRYRKEKSHWQLCLHTCPFCCPSTSCSQVQLKKKKKNTNHVLFIWVFSSLLTPLSQICQGPVPEALGSTWLQTGQISAAARTEAGTEPPQLEGERRTQ